jgi:hypothetical protein
VTDQRGIPEVEAMLRSAGPPADVPAHLHAAAREAALGGARPPDIVQLPTGRPVRWRVARLALVAAVLTLSTVAALVIGVGGNGMAVEHTVHMSGNAGASAVVDFGQADGALRPLRIKVSRLASAPDGRYYQMWLSKGDETMAVAVFDTDSGGSAELTSAMPADMGWDHCWVTLEDPSPNGASATVLRSTGA